VRQTLDIWLTVQHQWVYLEPIFSSRDIQSQLPLESKRFRTVNRTWRHQISNVMAHPNMLQFCSNSKLMELMQESNRVFEGVQKGLSVYLDMKRLAFSRFFFLSNDELLQILSQTVTTNATRSKRIMCK
jgi:dynein heavy chain